jgi:hypothetical protein
MSRQWVVLLILVCTGLSGAGFMWNLFEPVPLYWRTLRGAGHTPVQTPATHELSLVKAIGQRVESARWLSRFAHV